ncbi:hypothetical protein G3I44_13515 [Halogeometricum borinquense]|uniref:Uncharacterized protein n=1 Tax=Halogeometricum borinquense TaxID=60847 RepID=A0A6C0ULI0_9EURY|nr:hypothetical protein [Halogeometricum borinquense]QIB75211.1 hypothetical protein G3I44_13515 [Halogeometricum borinquense]
MNRRDYIKTVASLPVISSVPSIGPSEEDEEEWNVRGVWRREDETGYLAVRDDDLEAEFDDYNQWVSTTLRRFNAQHTVDLFDFRLISLYDGEYSRSHFSHEEAGLELTIKREPEEEVEFSAFVRAVDETWDEGREYASSSQIALAQKLKRERDKYL